MASEYLDSNVEHAAATSSSPFVFSKVTVTADVTYQDGTTDSESLQFSCMSADEKNGFIIGAKTA